MGDEDRDRVAPDRPTIDGPAIEDAPLDTTLQRALIETINPDGIAAFDREDWIRYAAAVVESLEIDRDDVVIVADDDDGVDLVDRTEYLRQVETLAGAADLAARWLRRLSPTHRTAVSATHRREIARESSFRRQIDALGGPRRARARGRGDRCPRPVVAVGRPTRDATPAGRWRARRARPERRDGRRSGRRR
ncbi:hypothetical protein [Natrinema sp. SYSU A 869]|uniref:hypothetical protein n=1 Tax=Natrinema sp. SYSU A 869 TaxID=2871694 RepID=UPI001CA449EF|nr:hypothetical protein [Natrinema sp. SYSU A 869]